MINLNVIVIVFIAIVCSVIMWGIIIDQSQENCNQNIENMGDEPNGIVAINCKNWGFVGSSG